MIYGTTYGKVLLVIEREGNFGSRPSFLIHPFIQTCSMTGTGELEIARGSAQEDLACLDYAGGVPKQCHRMAIGDCMRLSCTYLIEYSHDYWGEYDFEVGLTKVRLLRHQRFNPKRQPYLSKKS